MGNTTQICNNCGLNLTPLIGNNCPSCSGLNNPIRPRVRVIESDRSAIAQQIPSHGFASQVSADLTSADRLGRIRITIYSIGLYAIIILFGLLILSLIENPSTWDSVYAGIQAIWVFLLLPYFLIRIVSPWLHDMGKSGWIGLLLFIPLSNLAMLLALMLAPGQPKAV